MKPEGAEERTFSRRRSRPFSGGLALLVAVLILVGAVINLEIPYFAIAPGPTQNVVKLIDIEGAKTNKVKGELLLTTVSLHEIVVAEAIRGWFDASYEILSRSAIIPEGETEQDAERRTVAQMQESHKFAAAAALSLLGYEVKVTPAPARVLELQPDAPARRVLRRGDVIVGADATVVKRSEDFVAAIKKHEVGDEVVLKVRRGRKVLTVTTKTIPRSSDSSEPIIGVFLDTVPRVDLPLAIDIESLGIGGPSAGLMYAVGIFDLLHAADLAQGRRIAGTGEIDVDGKVGAVGGVRQKVAGAQRENAALFLVPHAELSDACSRAGDMPVVGVKTLREAVRALRDARFADSRSCR